LEELECPEHAGNLINRKITIFYIEIILKKFSTPKKNKKSKLEKKSTKNFDFQKSENVHP